MGQCTSTEDTPVLTKSDTVVEKCAVCAQRSTNTAASSNDNNQQLNLTPLHQLELKQLTDLPYKGQVIEVYISEVYDGDTCTIVYYVDRYPLRAKIRLSGIDAPEVKVKVKIEDRTVLHDLEEMAGAKVRDFVRPLILERYARVQLIKHGKYGGRMIGQVFLPGQDQTVSDLLLSRGYAKPYKGQKKEPWAAEELNHILQH